MYKSLLYFCNGDLIEFRIEMGHFVTNIAVEDKIQKHYQNKILASLSCYIDNINLHMTADKCMKKRKEVKLALHILW
jgi:hypothetical protein